LLSGLRARGGEVTPVRVYKWDLPEDVEPLREAARRLGLVTVAQMVNALVHAVENPAKGVKVVEVPEIRTAG
jgi:hypothetical protein